jgi:nucleoside-diphosphate-sugar epimerase
VERLRALGWRHKIELRDGIASTYDWFVANETLSARAVYV